MRHKYNSKPIGSNSGYTVNLGAVACLKCGLVKEIVKGKTTYFLDDNVYLKSPNCDERLIKNQNS